MEDDEEGGGNERWDEAMLRDLEPHEHDFQEFKGSAFLLEGIGIASGFRFSLSRQVSAFANGAGGHIFLGLDDEGRIDGGVPVDLKGGGVRAWLEDIIPDSVEPRLRCFNVFEVNAGGRDSAILPGRAVYVIHIPSSDNAPHQAKDHRYYLRIAGKSRPMGHVHVQDVLRRTLHPQIIFTRISPYGAPDFDDADPRGPRALFGFHGFIGSLGRTLARHVGAELILPRSLVTSQVRRLMLDDEAVRLTQRPGELVFFRYHPIPVFPGQEIFFHRFWVAMHARNLEYYRSGTAELRWRIYADDAPPTEGVVSLRRYTVIRDTIKRLEDALR